MSSSTPEDSSVGEPTPCSDAEWRADIALPTEERRLWQSEDRERPVRRTLERAAGNPWTDRATQNELVDKTLRVYSHEDLAIQLATKLRLRTEITELAKGQWKAVGRLRDNAVKASGTPCIYNAHLARSVRLQGEASSRGRLLISPLDRLGAASWRELELPDAPPGRFWSKRVYAFSTGRFLYVGVTVWEERMADIQPTVLYATDMMVLEKRSWHRVAEFSRSRLHFGAELFGDRLVVAGGCAYARRPGGGEDRRYLRSAECVTLDGLAAAGDWVKLPDLPRDAKKIRMVAYGDHICVVGTHGERYEDCCVVLTLPVAALDTRPPQQQQQQQQQQQDEQHPVTVSQSESLRQPTADLPLTWSDGKVPPIPYKHGALVVYDDVLVVAGGETPTGRPMSNMYALDVSDRVGRRRWLPLPAMPNPREHARLVPAKDGFYVIGGRSENRTCERLISRFTVPRLTSVTL